MAGIERLEIHSKSYVVRWIEVPEHQSISWSVQPQKKSICFGVFKHPGNKNGLTPASPTQETLGPPQTLPETPGQDGKPPRGGSVNASVVIEKLQGIGMRLVAWAGKCPADTVSMGRYNVPDGEGGTYGLVFDNTFSKQTSKIVTFVVMTHPTNAPPKSGHHLHYSQAFASGSTSSVGKGYSPASLKPVSDSSESLPPTTGMHRAVLEDPRPHSKGKGVESKGIEGTSFYTGVLHKKRRKKGQGYAKRFFSLDFTSSTLSYYHDRHSSALRGAVPLSLAAVGANEKTREFSVDSGAEVWHLKALNKKDFEGWRGALERASASVGLASTPTAPTRTQGGLSPAHSHDPAEDYEWARVEQLLGQVAGTRDAIRSLAKDTDPKYISGANGAGLGLATSANGSNIPSPSSYDSENQYFPEVDEKGQEKRPFWRRKPSDRTVSSERSPAALFRRSVSTQLAVPLGSTGMTPISPLPPASISVQKRGSEPRQPAQADIDVHERCMALLRNLDSVVSDFATLVAESKARRRPALPTSMSRLSVESQDDQEFYDAQDGTPMSPTQLLNIRRSSEFDASHDEQLFDHESDAESDVSSEAGDATNGSIFDRTPKSAQNALFPSIPQSLPPLPHQAVERRKTIAPPKQSPPSIIGFLRKNAGKDLSTVSMPVTANEPISLLQRLAESMEYSPLLDTAASVSLKPAERLIYVAAFAVSYFANNRVKERALRKPFNPMLGETYELVREDLGFRFVAEKVSHHPVRMACQAESLTNGGWCFTQPPQPIQKFWGKSVELNTEGRVRVVLHAPNEHYSWGQATCFLRNVIAGEKYVEPVHSMTIVSEMTGMRAVATFKSGGMFSGRSEDVTVELFDPASGDAPIALGLTGKWTDSLKRTDTGASVWSVGSLVSDAPKVYGFTTFAAALNDITEIEDGRLPPTDSRLRPDQQALESNEVDRAEELKARLEERQRSRRKVLESHGKQWQPQFFDRVTEGNNEAEEVWTLKEKNGYWDRRANGEWDGVQEVFEL